MLQTSQSDTHRLFIALWPEPGISGEITSLQSRLLNQYQLTGAKPVLEQNLHLTLFFLGSVSGEKKEQVIKKLEQVNGVSFDIVFDQVGCFSKPGILWLGPSVEPLVLSELVNQVTSLMGEIDLHRDKNFKPHVTLFRKVKKCRIDETVKPIGWTVNSFVLVESFTKSDGVEYSVLQEWRFSS